MNLVSLERHSKRNWNTVVRQAHQQDEIVELGYAGKIIE